MSVRMQRFPQDPRVTAAKKAAADAARSAGRWGGAAGRSLGATAAGVASAAKATFGRGSGSARPKRLTIVVDCRYTRFERHDGISRYAASLVAELAVLAQADGHTITMLISDRRQLDLLPALPWQLVSGPTSALEPLVALQVNRLRPDVVWSPMQTMGTLGRRYPLALTVHDLIYYRHRTPPRDLPEPVRLLWRLYHLAWWPQRMLLNGADAIVTVSRTTQELVEEHRLTSKPITVVSNAASATDARALETASARPDRSQAKSIVYMGSFMPYKNVETLVKALRVLTDYELHIMSRIDAATRDRLSALAPSGRIVFHDGATDAEYHDVLARSTALVTASRDEGFGIPLVEAMALGTPVVVSDIPIFREIGGEAASYAQATDAGAFVKAVRALERPEEWRRRSALSRERAAAFTWSASAERLYALLLGLARGRKA